MINTVSTFLSLHEQTFKETPKWEFTGIYFNKKLTKFNSGFQYKNLAVHMVDLTLNAFTSRHSRSCGKSGGRTRAEKLPVGHLGMNDSQLD